MGHVTTPNGRLQEAAPALASRGLSIIPIADLKDKSPALESWKPFTLTAATPKEAAKWFTPNGHPAAPGLGIVCGAVSGGLTVIDFDTRAAGGTLFDEWCDLMDKLVPGLVDTLPIAATPSGGRHVYFRCDVVEGNTKLAESATRQTWIETRGELGYVVAPPTPGYTLIKGRLSKIPTISAAQRDLLLHAARSFTCKPQPQKRLNKDDDPLPGDVYNATATMQTVCDLLARHGWKVIHEGGQRTTLRRPGKGEGISATVTIVNGVPIFYSFSTNAPLVPTQCGVSPFGLYAALEHGGDCSAAARAFAGYANTPGHSSAPKAAPTPVVEPFEWRAFIKNANDLRARVFAPIEWIVEGVIPSGLTLLAGDPKAGKSLLGLGIAVAVAQGGLALGNIQVKQRKVLYLLLEDGERLARKRLDKLVPPGVDLGQFDYAQQWRKLNEGGAEAIAQYCEAHPDALVVIDTYQSLRGTVHGAMDSYQSDYGALKPLSDVVHEKGLNVVLIHHTNKKGHEDPIAAINGSHGISGLCDTLCRLARVRFGDDCTLSIAGRELDCDTRFALDFDPETSRHTILGEVDNVGATTQQRDLVAVLKGQEGGLTPQEIAERTGRACDKALYEQLRRMSERGTIKHAAWGRYCLPGLGGQFHNSTFGNPDPPCPLPQDEGSQDTPEDGGNIESGIVEMAHSTLDAGRFMGVDAAIQAVPCDGCGKRWHKVPSPSGDGSLICRNCGVCSPIA